MDENLRDIRAFWNGRAKEHGIEYKASWEDYYCMQLEISTIVKYLNEGDRVLDIGCANGVGTMQIASEKNVAIKGIDYSEEMINAAQTILPEREKFFKGTVSFDNGDVLNLKEQGQSYDKAITKRVVINLKTIDNQTKAAREIHRILVPGGCFLMSEATTGGLQKINALRKEFGLEELKQPWHNLYIDEDSFVRNMRGLFEIVDIISFSSTYYIGSRVVQPFVKKLLNQPPNYLSEINRVFSLLPPCGDYGIQKLFVFRKV